MRFLAFLVLVLALATSIDARKVHRRTGSPLTCPAGTFNKKSGSTYKCVDCAKGFYREGTTTSAKALCLPCPSGTTSPVKSTSKAACVAAGSTPPTPGGSTPPTPSTPTPPAAPCAAGSGRTVLANGSVSASCSLCPTGSYNDGTLAICANCSSLIAVSTTKGAGATSAANCSCPSGTTPNAASPDGCVCPKGKGWSPVYTGSVITSYSCQACTAGNSLTPGTFNDGTTLRCSLCNNGSTTIITGAASCDVCFPGSGFNAAISQCTSCPAGQYNPGNNKSCSICPTVTTTSFSIVVTSQQDACQCNKGALAANGTSCISPAGYGWSDALSSSVACSGNTYNAGDNLYCVSCPNGQTANAAKTQCTCPSGTGVTAATGTSCVSCSVQGTKWNNGSSLTCSAVPALDNTIPGGAATTGVSLDNSQPTCAAGSGWVWGSSGLTGACVACASTKFNDGSYFVCQSCPTNTLPTTAAKPAAGKPQCTCDGTLVPTQGYSFATGICSPCPAGTYISGTLGCTPCAAGAFCGASTTVDVTTDPNALAGTAATPTVIGKQAKFTKTTINYGVCTSGVTIAGDVTTVTTGATTTAHTYTFLDFAVRAQDLSLGQSVLGDGILTDTTAAATKTTKGTAVGANGVVDPGRWSSVGAKTAADCYCLLDGTQVLDVAISSLTVLSIATKPNFVSTDFAGNLQFCQECAAGTNNTYNGVPGTLAATAIPAVPSPKCKPCPKGYYQSLAGQATCVACPAGTTTSGTQLATGPVFCA